MASWMVHLRVADRLLDRLPEAEPTWYVVGNLGPDCGEPTNRDATQYTPPKSVTHWQTARAKHDAEAFWRAYLEGGGDPTRRSFYLGYWTHLLTDERWVADVARPIKERFAREYAEDYPGYVRRVRQDWSDLDRLFLREHPSFRAYRLLEAVERFPNDGLLPYYSETAIERRLRAIAAAYRQPCGEVDRVYPYLSRAEMDRFVDRCAEAVWLALQDKTRLPAAAAQQSARQTQGG